ncbi:MAG: dTDP-glucose 4,6-dehydratase [Alistipes sp.]|nr:dTDP-glucose 4,6-dehydratase [Alistipes sp.]
MFKSILITGGAGFIGSHVVEHFVRNTESRIIVLDKLTYAGNRANIEPLIDDSRVIFVEGDICDGELVESIFARYDIDGVAHLAAESHVDRSISAPMLFAQNNILGTITLLEAARKAWRGREKECRFLHVSTDEVYGTLNFDAEPFNELSRYEPHSPYSASKASSDHFVRAYHDTYGLPTLITNCSNNYGPRQYPEKLIPLFIKNIVERKPLPVYGTGRNVRDWLYVGDHAEALAAVLQRGTVGQTYNIGGNNEWSNIELVKELIRLTDEALGRPTGESLSLISYVEDRAGHDLRYAINATKIGRELGWQPRTPFSEGLRSTVAWYLNNKFSR